MSPAPSHDSHVSARRQRATLPVTCLTMTISSHICVTSELDETHFAEVLPAKAGLLRQTERRLDLALAPLPTTEANSLAEGRGQISSMDSL